MSFISLRSLSTRAIQITNNKNAALLNYTRLYTAASTPTKFATIDESARAQKQMAFGRDLSAAANNAHGELRFDWKKEEIDAIYHSPIMELLYHGVSCLSSLCWCFLVFFLRLFVVFAFCSLAVTSKGGKPNRSEIFIFRFFYVRGVRFYFVGHMILHSDMDTTIATNRSTDKRQQRQQHETRESSSSTLIHRSLFCGHNTTQQHGAE